MITDSSLCQGDTTILGPHRTEGNALVQKTLTTNKLVVSEEAFFANKSIKLFDSSMNIDGTLDVSNNTTVHDTLIKIRIYNHR
jgi:hypothetical protein